MPCKAPGNREGAGVFVDVLDISDEEIEEVLGVWNYTQRGVKKRPPRKFYESLASLVRGVDVVAMDSDDDDLDV